MQRNCADFLELCRCNFGPAVDGSNHCVIPEWSRGFASLWQVCLGRYSRVIHAFSHFQLMPTFANPWFFVHMGPRKLNVRLISASTHILLRMNHFTLTQHYLLCIWCICMLDMSFCTLPLPDSCCRLCIHRHRLRVAWKRLCRSCRYHIHDMHRYASFVLAFQTFPSCSFLLKLSWAQSLALIRRQQDATLPALLCDWDWMIFDELVQFCVMNTWMHRFFLIQFNA